VHRHFAALHREGGWRGDGERFGVSAAVLAGDMCLVWTDELLAHSGLTPAQLAAARPVFDRMRTELLGGQYLDVLDQAVPAPDPVGAVERARHVIRYKSAKYSVEHPLLLGARLAGAPEALLRSYTAFGLPLGEAFQLRDDVLGVFGDPDETGKPAGDDLREGKRTVLVGLALQTANRAQAALVRRLLGDRRLDAGGVAALRGVLVDTGALERTEAMISELVGEASAVLAGSQVAQPAREVLARLAVAATARVR
jgi:geranylgeranyl diphosphate synthase type I